MFYHSHELANPKPTPRLFNRWLPYFVKNRQGGDAISSKRRSASWSLSVLFIFILLLPTVDLCFHIDHAIPPNEKRGLAEFPEYKGVSQLKVFLAGLESYFNDHFGFRKRLIRTNNHWKHQLFAEPVHNVTVGRNGWLFYNDRMIEDYTGITRFKEQDLKDWQKLLETRRDWLAQRGCQYVFVVPPDKQSIYPEHLPEWLVKSKKPLKLDQFLEHMRTHSTVRIVDLRAPIQEAKKVMPTYLMTDTHWNKYGGFVGYQSLINTLSNVFPDLAPLPLSAFSTNIFETGDGGDMAMILGDNSMHEQFVISIMPQPPLATLEATNVFSRLPKKWKKDTDPMMTLNTNATRKAIVFRDSFSGSWMHFLGQHFHEVLYIWQYEWDRSFLDREKPDIVIDEILERFFLSRDPKKLMEADISSAEINKNSISHP